MRQVVAAIYLILLSGLLQARETAVVQAPWTLLDQFDQAYTLNDQLRILLVARSMDGAKVLKQALEGKPHGYLEARNAIFVADVSQMPGLIATLFAIPAMQDYSYRVLLDRQPRVVPRYPGATDSVLWLDLGNGQIQSQREFTDPVELARALQQVAQ